MKWNDFGERKKKKKKVNDAKAIILSVLGLPRNKRKRKGFEGGSET